MADLFANPNTIMLNANILIAGPRWVKSYGVVKLFMDKLFQGLESELQPHVVDSYKQTLTIISGGADGIDTNAERYANERSFTFKEYPAKWDDLEDPRGVKIAYKQGKPYNRLAGFHRNKEMIRDANVAIVYWDGVSPGSKHSHEQCQKKANESQGSFLYIPVRIMDKETLNTVSLLYRDCIKANKISAADKRTWYKSFNMIDKVQIWDTFTPNERKIFGVLVRK